MKVIDPSDAEQKLDRRIHAIEHDLHNIRNELDAATVAIIPAISSAASLPSVDRHRFLVSMSTIAHMALDFQKASRDAQEESEFHSVGFVSFPHLPTEIRLKVWLHAMELELRPKVHCVAHVYNGFMSNQALSPLLSINSESREYFLANTKSTFAFATYINFDIDTIYIPFFRCRDDILYPPNDETSDEDPDDETAGEDKALASATYDPLSVDDPAFLAFLEDPSAAKIQTLAMRHEFEKDIPLTGHMAESHARMRLALKAWSKTYVVFEDLRDDRERWLDTNAGFKDLSARQKRTRAERGYARQHAKVLNSMIDTMENIDLEEMKYSFCFVEPGDEVTFAKRWHALD